MSPSLQPAAPVAHKTSMGFEAGQFGGSKAAAHSPGAQQDMKGGFISLARWKN